MNIRPVSDLRNHYPEVERQATEEGPVFLTKNGYGSMVVMTLEDYERLTDPIERALNEADAQAVASPVRLTHEEVFASLRERFPHVLSA